jgi:hypothetical protein
VAFVHGVPVEEADPWFERAGLGDISRVSDPALAHYRAFDLATTGTAALFHLQLWARGAVCALAYGFGQQPAELIRQLPGVFVVHGTRILAEFRHASPSDRPDYLELIRRAASVTIR